MIPDLQAVYGGDQERWLDLPAPLLRTYVEAMARIQAARSLVLASAVALGSGTLEREDARRLQRDLMREAGADQVKRPSTMAEVAAVARAMGITVVQEPPVRKGSEE